MYLPRSSSGLTKFIATAAGAAFLILAGCTSDGTVAYSTYGEPYYYTSDYYYSGYAYSPYPYYYKRSAAAVTLPGEQVTEPLTFHADCSCYVRKATYTREQGFERDDSIQFFDSLGMIIPDTVKTVKAAKVTHKRHVVKTNGGRDADILFDMTIDGRPRLGPDQRHLERQHYRHFQRYADRHRLNRLRDPRLDAGRQHLRICPVGQHLRPTCRSGFADRVQAGQHGDGDHHRPPERQGVRPDGGPEFQGNGT